jgi:hypothetical protein
MPKPVTLADMRAAQMEAERLVEQHGFHRFGATALRTAYTDGGKAVTLPSRKRWAHRDGLRVTIGRDTTYFYQMVGEQPVTVAVLKTLETLALRRTLKRLLMLR